METTHSTITRLEPRLPSVLSKNIFKQLAVLFEKLLITSRSTSLLRYIEISEKKSTIKQLHNHVDPALRQLKLGRNLMQAEHEIPQHHLGEEVRDCIRSIAVPQTPRRYEVQAPQKSFVSSPKFVIPRCQRIINDGWVEEGLSRQYRRCSDATQ